MKPSSLHDNDRGLRILPDGFTSENLPLKEVLRFAYDLRSDDQLAGTPGWVNSENYDIDAKESDETAGELSRLSSERRLDQLRRMVQSLLADRFGLKVRFQTKKLPAYALLVAKSGSKLIRTPPPAGAKSSEPPSGTVGMERGFLFGRGVSTQLLASILSRQPDLGGRVVVDETGLTGGYDLQLKWTPEFSSPIAMNGAVSQPAASAADVFSPSLFTALEEQLGLRLKAIKSPQQVVVIVHIEKPSQN